MNGDPRRVLMTADAVGGVWPYVLELGRGLRTAGIEVSLVVMGPAPRPAQRAAWRATGQGAPEVAPFQLEWMEGGAETIGEAAAWLGRFATETRPDLLHLNGYALAAFPWQQPVLCVAHSCVGSWWEAVHGRPAPARWSRYRDAVRRGLRAADHVVAPSRFMRAALHRLYGPGLAAVSVIPNGRTLPPRPVTAREPVVLAAGRLWDAAKNLETLTRAASGLPWPVRVAGEGGDAATNSLHWLGMLDAPALREAMGRAAIFAHPARYEPFGLAVLEAAGAGCALVLGDTPSLREYWQGAARFVPPNDADALHRALAGLIASRAERERLARAAHRRSRQLGAARMVAAYRSRYRALLGRPARPYPGRMEGAPCTS